MTIKNQRRKKHCLTMMKNILVLLFLVGFNLKIAAQTYETCPQDIPAGYVIISYRPCAGCCGLGGEIVQMPTIQRIDHLPAGTTMEICPQAAPPGWVVISYRSCAGCCGVNGQIAQLPTIMKINNLPSGTTIEICPQSIPAGWQVTGYQLCAGCCGKTGELTKMLIISN